MESNERAPRSRGTRSPSLIHQPLVGSDGFGGFGALGSVSSSSSSSSSVVRVLRAWSIVHGFATLWLSGALPPRVGTDPEAAARTVISRLFT